MNFRVVLDLVVELLMRVEQALCRDAAGTLPGENRNWQIKCVKKCIPFLKGHQRHAL